MFFIFTHSIILPVGYFHMFKFLLADIVSFFFRFKNDVWLVGEYLGKSTKDNGFFFFEYLMKSQPFESCLRNIYFVYEGKLPDKLRPFSKHTVKKNSLRHYLLYKQAEYVIVSHGIADATPKYIMQRKGSRIKPLIYLQHGVTKFKSIYYNSQSYNKSILRFIASSEEEKEILVKEMQPKNVFQKRMFLNWKSKSLELASSIVDEEVALHLLKYDQSTYSKELSYYNDLVGIDSSRVVVTGFPRHDGLYLESSKQPPKNQILIFPTWRDSLEDISFDDFESSDFFVKYKELVCNEFFQALLKKYHFSVKFILHCNMMKYRDLFSSLNSKLISFADSSVDIRDSVIESKYLITDYSSLAWEFVFLQRPVIFYQFDYDEYFSIRDSYVKNDSDWCGVRCFNVEETIDAIQRLLAGNVERVNSQYSFLKFQDSENCQRIYNEIKSIPPKVYFLAYNIYGIGGTVRTTINAANYLYHNGYDVEIISVKQTSTRPSLGLHPGVKINPLFDIQRNSNRYSFMRLKSLIREKSYHLYLALEVPLFLLGYFKKMSVKILGKFPSMLIHRDEDLYGSFSLFTDIKIYKTLRSLHHCTLVTTIPSFNCLSVKVCHKSVRKIGQEHMQLSVHSKRLQKKMKRYYKKLDSLTLLTSGDYQEYEKSNMIDPRKLLVLGNGTPVEENIDLLLNSRPNKIITMARFSPGKRIDLLIEAFALVANRHTDWTLDIYGDGQERENIQKLIRDKRLTSSVSIKPSTPNIKEILMGASIFALPSEREGFGMTIIEANSYGLPVVAFDVPYGPKDLILHKETGLLSTPMDIQDFANNLIFLIENPSERIIYAKRAYEFVLSNYSSKSIGEKLETILG